MHDLIYVFTQIEVQEMYRLQNLVLSQIKIQKKYICIGNILIQVKHCGDDTLVRQSESAFNIPSTMGLIRRRDLGLKPHPKDQRSGTSTYDTRNGSPPYNPLLTLVHWASEPLTDYHSLVFLTN